LRGRPTREGGGKSSSSSAFCVGQLLGKAKSARYCARVVSVHIVDLRSFANHLESTTLGWRQANPLTPLNFFGASQLGFVRLCGEAESLRHAYDAWHWNILRSRFGGSAD
jgi:hypothetical protein